MDKHYVFDCCTYTSTNSNSGISIWTIAASVPSLIELRHAKRHIERTKRTHERLESNNLASRPTLAEDAQSLYIIAIQVILKTIADS